MYIDKQLMSMELSDPELKLLISKLENVEPTCQLGNQYMHVLA